MTSDGGATIKPKRGRRSKKEIEAAKAELEAKLQSTTTANINVIAEQPMIDENVKQEVKTEEDNENNIAFSIDCESANEIVNEIVNDIVNDNIIPQEELETEENVVIKQGLKKRGRKPKGGKIVQQTAPLAIQKESKPNIILHLKCSLKDLSSSGDHNSNFTAANVDPYSFESKNEITYELLANNVLNNLNLENQESASGFYNANINGIVNGNANMNTSANINAQKIYAIKDTISHTNDDNDDDLNNTNDTRELWRKLKVLEQDLHINNISDKKSACFWCSYDFDNPAIYIPKHFIKNSYHVYGCFCTPECAVAHLMEENIDSSTKFERYQLINHIYSKIYEYKKNVKPAPNPHYMLDKYYGNLTIQEYRALLRSDRLFLIVDKPLTRILPEFHEDNDDFIINNKIIPSNNYQVKKRLQKKAPQTKSNILNEKFGIQNVVAPAQ
jgi:hypothetical protein